MHNIFTIKRNRLLSMVRIGPKRDLSIHESLELHELKYSCEFSNFKMLLLIKIYDNLAQIFQIVSSSYIQCCCQNLLHCFSHSGTINHYT